MKTFNQFIESYWNSEPGTWDGSYGGHKVGFGQGHVMVNRPGDPNHGKRGRIVRQQSTDYGIEMPHAPGKLHWYNAAHLTHPN